MSIGLEKIHCNLFITSRKRDKKRYNTLNFSLILSSGLKTLSASFGSWKNGLNYFENPSITLHIICRTLPGAISNYKLVLKVAVLCFRM